MIQNTHMQDCIDNCHNVQETSLAAVNYCMETGQTDVECVGMLMSAAEVSAAAAKLMMIESEFHPRMCGVCADVCDAVAEYFQDEDDETFARVTTLCRACADSCREMSGMKTRSFTQRSWNTGYRPWV